MGAYLAPKEKREGHQERQETVGYRIDMRLDRLVLVENKTVEKVLPINLAQLSLRDGIQRVVRNHPEELASG